MTAGHPIGRAYLLLWATTAAAAAAAALFGPLAHATRDALHLELAPHAASPAGAAWTIANNALAGGWPALLSLLRVTQAARRVLLCSWLAVNAVPVGLAVGAYGAHLMPYLAHLPLEWAALALPLAANLTATPPGPRARLLGAGAFFALLAAAAAAETYLTPHH